MREGGPAPIIVTALFDAADAAMLEVLRRAHYPPERNHVPAHLTLFRHLPPSAAREVKDLLKREAAARAPAALLTGVVDLGTGTALGLRSPELETLRARLAEALAAVLIPQDSAGWRPHITIQNKVRRAEALALQRALAGRFDGRPLALKGLAAHHYRGGPWERIGAWPFRG